MAHGFGGATFVSDGSCGRIWANKQHTQNMRRRHKPQHDVGGGATSGSTCDLRDRRGGGGSLHIKFLMKPASIRPMIKPLGPISVFGNKTMDIWLHYIDLSLLRWNMCRIASRPGGRIRTAPSCWRRNQDISDLGAAWDITPGTYRLYNRYFLFIHRLCYCRFMAGGRMAPLQAVGAPDRERSELFILLC